MYGLLGPNGAGKTTLVKQVIGLLQADVGAASCWVGMTLWPILPQPASCARICLRRRFPLTRSGPGRRSCCAGASGAAIRRRSRRADELIEALDLGEWRKKRGISLSGGVKRLVGFAMVTVCPGRVVILDEPTNDVDPLRRRLLWQQIRELGNLGVAVFLVTHNVLEAEKAVDRLAIIDNGRLLPKVRLHP